MTHVHINIDLAFKAEDDYAAVMQIERVLVALRGLSLPELTTEVNIDTSSALRWDNLSL